jgi:hypothetical protein
LVYSKEQKQYLQMDWMDLLFAQRDHRIDLDKHCRAKVSERNKKKVPAPRCDGTKRALQSLLSPVLGHLLMIWSRCSGLL